MFLLSLHFLLWLHRFEPPPKPVALKIEAQSPQQGTQPTEPTLSLEMEKAKLGDILREIAKRTGTSLIADAYVNDTTMHTVSIGDSPLSYVLKTLATTFGKTLVNLNGIYVFRSTNFALSSLHEQTALRDLDLHWTGKGLVKFVRPQGESESLLTKLPASLISRLRAEGKKIPELPALALSMEVLNAPLGEVVRDFSTASGWRVAVEPELAERRISGFVSKATPGQLLHAIGFLMNTSAKITLERNDANRLLEADLLDSRLARLKLSDALLSKLASHLTEEQKRKLQSGGTVSLSLKELSGDARRLAQDYAKQGLIGALPNGMALDLSRLGDFALNLSPGALAVGIDGYLTNGLPIHY